MDGNCEIFLLNVKGGDWFFSVVDEIIRIICAFPNAHFVWLSFVYVFFE